MFKEVLLQMLIIFKNQFIFIKEWLVELPKIIQNSTLLSDTHMFSSADVSHGASINREVLAKDCVGLQLALPPCGFKNPGSILTLGAI